MIIHVRRSGNSLANDAACWISFYNVSEKISISTRGPCYMLLPLLMEKVPLPLPLYSQFYSIKLITLKKKKKITCTISNGLVVGLISFVVSRKK